EHLDMAHHTLDAEAIHTALKDLLALAQVWPEASARQIRRGAERVAKRAKRARKHAIGESAAEPRHEWRKREKERLYVAEILDKAWPYQRKRASTERLTATLGRERDARLLTERLTHSAANDHAGTKKALEALKRRRKRLVRRADKIGRKLKSA